MNGKFSMIHHCKNSIQMHKGTLFWNVNGQDFLKVCLFGQHLLGKFLNGIFMGALRNADGNRLFV